MFKHIKGLAKFYVHYLFFGQIGTSKTFFGQVSYLYLSVSKYRILLFPNPWLSVSNWQLPYSKLG